MKRMILVSSVCAFVLIFAAVALARPKAQPCTEGPCAIGGTYSSVEGNFKNIMWKETSSVGSHGALGNELMAVGNSYMFKNAVLTNVQPAGQSDFDTPVYETTYEGGELRLNSSADWLNCGQLVATGIIATNSSYRDLDDNLYFTLTFQGTFDNCDCTFDVTVNYDGSQDRYQEVIDEQDNLVFHRGRDFDTIIDITCPQEPE